MRNAGAADGGRDAERREARRRFLQRCGRFAAITPPAVTLMLAGHGASRYAVAQSAGQTTRDTGDGFLGLKQPGAPEPGEVGPGTPGIRG